MSREIKKTRVSTSAGPDIEIWEVNAYEPDEMDDIAKDVIEASDKEYIMIMILWACHSPEEYWWYYRGSEIGYYDDETNI